MSHCTVQYEKTPAKIGTPGSADMLATGKTPATAGTQAAAETKATEGTKATARTTPERQQ